MLLWDHVGVTLDFVGVTVGERESESADQIGTKEVFGGRHKYNSR